METNRQKKIGALLQKDIVDILQRSVNDSPYRGVIVSVTKVKVTTDLSIAKVYLSIFPTKDASDLIDEIKKATPAIRYELSQRTKNQLRRMPELEFFIDDSLDYIDKIERSLKGEDNPLEDPDLLEKRKKK